MRGLSSEFTPQLVEVALPCPEDAITAVQQELTDKAETDTDKCWGYFPAMANRSGIDTTLPVSQTFVDNVPNLTMNGRILNFNFLRLSLVEQSSDAPYHLDSDAATALTGDTSTIAKRLVWRLLLNLGTHNRTLSYLDVDPFSVELDSTDGYINCPAEYVTSDITNAVVLAPRMGRLVNGVLFCSSRVLHTGKDDEYGHFVAGYGVEE